MKELLKEKIKREEMPVFSLQAGSDFDIISL
jgi:hypothetical protein